MAQSSIAPTGKTSAKSTNPTKGKPAKSRSLGKRTPTAIVEALALAEEQGLLAGPRTLVVRARMPAALVKAAKRRTGIASDSKLLEAALANVANVDDYMDWLISRSGTIDPALDLDF